MNGYGDIIGIAAYSLGTCLDACSLHYDMNGEQDGCRAIQINRNMKDRVSADSANCWLKKSVGNISSGKMNGTAAILLLP